MDATRIDKWLWAVRVHKTRSIAAAACENGRVRVNGNIAKPSTAVRIGDRVVISSSGLERTFEVVQVIEKRVSAPLAAECVVDHSPPPPTLDDAWPPFRRDPSAGRPTKKDRRQIDRFRNRS
jgi:ribosome-associated heat shock protein Hsp15